MHEWFPCSEVRRTGAAASGCVNRLKDPLLTCLETISNRRSIILNRVILNAPTIICDGLFNRVVLNGWPQSRCPARPPSLWTVSDRSTGLAVYTCPTGGDAGFVARAPVSNRRMGDPSGYSEGQQRKGSYIHVLLLRVKNVWWPVITLAAVLNCRATPGIGVTSGSIGLQLPPE